MSILDNIVSVKRLEVRERKVLYPVHDLEKSELFRKKPFSLKESILKEASAGVIAEFKRRSPSKGYINENAAVREVCSGYSGAGASAVSVLTNSEFFGGSAEDLVEARRHADCPVLCKDFIIDEYQVIEARSHGADAVLLIADILSAADLRKLHRRVLSLGMEALIEVHDRKFLSLVPDDANIIGINSRNLASFKVSPDHAFEMANLLPVNVVKVAESGIKSIDDYFHLKSAGFNGFLIGEYFMNTTDPAKTCRDFIGAIRQRTGSEHNTGI